MRGASARLRPWLLALLVVGAGGAALAVWRTPVEFELGYAYEAGNFHGWTLGFARNHARAAYWLDKAAAQGHPRAEYMLGLLYAHGWGVPRSDRRALHWFAAAAHNGYVQAMYHLGWMYHKGDGVARDRAAGLALMRRAADNGMAGARLALGEFYEGGDGVPADPVQALKWYLLAVRSCRTRPEVFGNGARKTRALAARDRLLAELSPSDVGMSRRLAHQWRAVLQ
ncbi:MAG: tetratricopeptide repeat protein [Gammaproteobacteria bacterium]